MCRINKIKNGQIAILFYDINQKEIWSQKIFLKNNNLYDIFIDNFFMHIYPKLVKKIKDIKQHLSIDLIHSITTLNIIPTSEYSISNIEKIPNQKIGISPTIEHILIFKIYNNKVKIFHFKKDITLEFEKLYLSQDGFIFEKILENFDIYFLHNKNADRFILANQKEIASHY